MDKSTGRNQLRERLTRDGPGEPVAPLVLVREDRGAHAENDQLFERGVLRGLPRLAPHLIPPRKDARMPMSALAVLDGDAARHDRAVALEPLTHLAKSGGRETERGLQVLDGARPGPGQESGSSAVLGRAAARCRSRRAPSSSADSACASAARQSGSAARAASGARNSVLPRCSFVSKTSGRSASSPPPPPLAFR